MNTMNRDALRRFPVCARRRLITGHTFEGIVPVDIVIC